MLSRETVVLGRLALEIQAKEINCAVCRIVSVVCPLGRVPTDHSKVSREGCRCSRLVGIEVVDHGTTVQARETSVCPLEVEQRCPVIGLVLDDRGGCADALLQMSGRHLQTEIAASKDDVGVARHIARVYNRIDAFFRNIVHAHEPVGVGDAGTEGQRQESRRESHNARGIVDERNVMWLKKERNLSVVQTRIGTEDQDRF